MSLQIRCNIKIKEKKFKTYDNLRAIASFRPDEMIIEDSLSLNTLFKVHYSSFSAKETSCKVSLQEIYYIIAFQVVRSNGEQGKSDNERYVPAAVTIISRLNPFYRQAVTEN